jgi:hypothetical protein
MEPLLYKRRKFSDTTLYTFIIADINERNISLVNHEQKIFRSCEVKSPTIKLMKILNL